MAADPGSTCVVIAVLSAVLSSEPIFHEEFGLRMNSGKRHRCELELRVAAELV